MDKIEKATSNTEEVVLKKTLMNIQEKEEEISTNAKIFSEANAKSLKVLYEVLLSSDDDNEVVLNYSYNEKLEEEMQEEEESIINEYILDETDMEDSLDMYDSCEIVDDYEEVPKNTSPEDTAITNKESDESDCCEIIGEIDASTTLKKDKNLIDFKALRDNRYFDSVNKIYDSDNNDGEKEDENIDIYEKHNRIIELSQVNSFN